MESVFGLERNRRSAWSGIRTRVNVAQVEADHVGERGVPAAAHLTRAGQLSVSDSHEDFKRPSLGSLGLSQAKMHSAPRAAAKPGDLGRGCSSSSGAGAKVARLLNAAEKDLLAFMCFPVAHRFKPPSTTIPWST